ncbi:MAG: Xaa-Pro dipeptidase, partial [Gammaproteobacteria bacterium]|nr:Xaa-Pro dipeptidase [Gammaproteobacteria bacterium]
MSVASLDQLYTEHLQTVMNRTDRSLAATGYDALVIQAGSPPVQFLDDQDYPYKVNPHFKAWVPITDNPQSLVIYRPGTRPRVLFHQPDDYWHQAASLPEDAWTQAVELIPLPDPSKASAYWATLGKVAFIGPRNNADDAQAESVNPPELLTRLHYDRAVKTPYELECMRRASAFGALGHRAALAAFRRGASEYEAHMRYLEGCVQREEELPYNNIVAYNEHAAVLHYQHLERRAPAQLRSFLIDAGAQYRGYASDITRTYAASAGRFADLIDIMNAAQLRLCDEILAGRDYREVHLSAHRILGDAMHEIGLTTVSGEEALRRGVTSVFFPHGIGHLLGLQVHDVGGVMGDIKGGERGRPEGHPYLRLTRMLEPGVVVTVEPGIYFIGSLLAKAHGDERRPLIDWSVVDELRPFGGIRIEDNVATTAGRPENLTRDAFAKLAA